MCVVVFKHPCLRQADSEIPFSGVFLLLHFLFTYVVCELYSNHDVYLYQDICELTSSIYIPRGINVTSLNHDQTWPFQPSKLFKVSTCNLKSCCQIHSFMSYSNPALLLALFFLLLLFSRHCPLPHIIFLPPLCA